jgi:hypothetical protein
MYKVIKNLCKELVNHGCIELKSITDKYYKKDKETNENISYTLKPDEPLILLLYNIKLISRN